MHASTVATGTDTPLVLLSIFIIDKHATVNSQSDGRLVSKVSGCGKDVSSALGRTNRCRGARTSLTYTHHNVHGMLTIRLHLHVYTYCIVGNFRGEKL